MHEYTSLVHVARGSVFRHRVAVCCNVFQCGAVWCSVVQCGAVCCSVLQCDAVCCSVLLCVAVCCSVLQCVAKETHARVLSSSPALSPFRLVYCIMLSCVAVCCSASMRECISRFHIACCIVLQCIAVCCSVLQRVAAQTCATKIFTHCSTLKQTAAHCSTLQQPKAHCNIYANIFALTFFFSILCHILFDVFLLHIVSFHLHIFTSLHIFSGLSFV